MIFEYVINVKSFTGGFPPKDVAIDNAGNLYILDDADWLVWKVTPSGDWTTIGSGYNRPAGIALDSFGNVFVADFGNNRVVKITPAGVESTVGKNLLEPDAVTVDGTGNIYISDFGNGRIVKISRHTPPALAFARTIVGSSDSPKTVTLENIGNTALIFPTPSAGKNASLSANVSFAANTTCPELNDSSKPETLVAGSVCNYRVTFAPSAAGSITGSLTTTDNNLNGSDTQQIIPLKGSAVLAPKLQPIN
jgi:hypothetical protein